jgi:hypothetical protein
MKPSVAGNKPLKQSLELIESQRSAIKWGDHASCICHM